jgi:hypothetical protein
MTDAANHMLRSASPDARAFPTPTPGGTFIYCTSVNPSLRSNSSAVYWGAKQTVGAWINLNFVVSGGGSAAITSVDVPSIAPAPAKAPARRNFRRLQPLSVGLLIVVSLHATLTLILDQPSAIPRLTPHASLLTDFRLRFQLLLQLPQKPPIGSLRDNLLRARLDHARLLKAERVEPDAVLGVIVAPLAVRYLFK